MSAVPAVLDGLVAALTAGMPGVTVLDGPPTTKALGDLVAVGITPADPTEVESVAAIAGLSAVHESFPVLCLARSWSGNDAIKPQRDRTYELIGAVEGVLAGDPTLDGVVTRARFAGSTYAPWRSERGQLVVDVVFRVEVDAL